MGPFVTGMMWMYSNLALSYPSSICAFPDHGLFGSDLVKSPVSVEKLPPTKITKIKSR
jgi:hypothetical protein